jgi:hypothetical protein
VMRLRGVSSRAMVQAVLTKVSCTASIGI